MCSLADSGWSRCKKDKESVTEAEVKHLFDMIDRDKSGALTMRVSGQTWGISTQYIYYLCSIIKRNVFEYI